MSNSQGEAPHSEELSVRFPGVLYERFDAICRDKGYSKSEIVRTLVDDFVETYSSNYDLVQDPDQIEAF